MHRRAMIATLGATALAGPAFAAKKDGKPVMIPGTPPKLDFGGGLLIPMDAGIFKTLWEGQDRWITYGRGVKRQQVAAMAAAEDAAVAVMKLMLITLAFKPDLLVRVEGGGWRVKSGNVADLVRGDVPLPGRPVMPTVDRLGEAGEDGEPMISAITGYMLMKKDVSLDDVKASAKLVPPGT